jgi:hypothetical protein
MSYYGELIRAVDKGRSGKSISIPLPFPRLAELVDTTRNQYTLVGGNSGSGKSSLVHQAHVLDTYDWWYEHRHDTDIKLRIFVRSMERAKEFYVAKWACYRIYKEYKYIIHPRLILGRVAKSRVSDELYDIITAQLDYFEEMQDHVKLITGSPTATQIENHLRKWGDMNGTLHVIDENMGLYDYKPNDENLITITVLDHIGRIKANPRQSRKEAIDEVSQVLAKARDLYGFSCVVVSQFNRSISDVYRRKAETFFPEETDFKETGNIFEDSDVCFTLFDPKRFGRADCLRYTVNKFTDPKGNNRFRVLTLLKNTLGTDQVHLPLNFIGEMGMFKELKRVTDMTDEDYKKAVFPPSRPTP